MIICFYFGLASRDETFDFMNHSTTDICSSINFYRANLCKLNKFVSGEQNKKHVGCDSCVELEIHHVYDRRYKSQNWISRNRLSNNANRYTPEKRSAYDWMADEEEVSHDSSLMGSSRSCEKKRETHKTFNATWKGQKVMKLRRNFINLHENIAKLPKDEIDRASDIKSKFRSSLLLSNLLFLIHKIPLNVRRSRTSSSRCNRSQMKHLRNVSRILAGKQETHKAKFICATAKRQKTSSQPI